MKLVARLVVYATAMIVVFTARLPEPVPAATALRAAVPDPGLDPVRLLIAAVLAAGIAIELLRRRTVWR